VSKKAENAANFLDRKVFSFEIEEFVYKHKMSYMDTIVHLCEVKGLEIEDIKKYLTVSILDNLESEARSLNFLPKLNTLDV
jgi:hypothetical protein